MASGSVQRTAKLFSGVALVCALGCARSDGPVQPSKAEVKYRVTTLAGLPGMSGFRNGLVDVATFNFPFALTKDGSGNLYIADQLNYAIRKVEPGGLVSTLAGGTFGYVDGWGAAAHFGYLHDILMDGTGYLVVADYIHHVVRKISRYGEVTTAAGSTISGNADGQGLKATFTFPFGLAVDRAGDLYVTDNASNVIRKISPTYYVSTLAGKANQAGSVDGPGSEATFSRPAYIAADTTGTLYVTDTDSNLIRKIEPDGRVSTLAGRAGHPGSADGLGRMATFSNPSGIAADGKGNLYVADTDSNLIRKIDSGGFVTTIAGRRGMNGHMDGAGAVATFSGPAGIYCDGAAYLYVADFGNNVIRRIALE